MEESRRGVKAREALGRGTLNFHCLTIGSSCELVPHQEGLQSSRETLATSLAGSLADPGSEDVRSMRSPWLRERVQDLSGF